MAKGKTEVEFKKVQIDLEDNILYEFKKDETKEYVLSDLLKKYSGDNVYAYLKFFEEFEVEPEDITEE